MPYLTLPRLATALALAGVCSLSHAAGFALIEQNASGLGNAYAGQAAVAADASTVFFNPAGMSLLPDSQLVLAGNLIKPSAKFSGTVTAPFPVGGGAGGDAGDWALVPNVYYTHRLSPAVTLGVGLNSPFGLKTEYDSNWMGRYQAIKSELKTINLNPSIAYKVSDTFSVGAGFSVQWVQAELTNNLPRPVNGMNIQIKGDDYGWGYNLGALWQPAAATRVGLAYRSEIDFTVDANSKTSNPSVGALNGPVTADITMPASASLSLVQKLDPKWDLLADVTWTGWSSFDKLVFKGTVNKTTPENWQDSWRYSLGVTWHQDAAWIWRAGVAYDETPVQDAFRTARIPDNNRTWLALGGQYRLSDKSALDFGYAYLFIDDASINNTDNGTVLKGSYDNSVNILSVQYTRTF